MTFPDYLVLALYLAGMAGIGFWSMRTIKRQEDYFMGGRRFGKLFQTFAAFGAGTGSADPVNTTRTTFTSGMSGMWSVMYWLFVTPVYWISAVWYRRMRCLTLGDWFVERYESRSLGVAYAVFGLLYYMVYGSMLFSAISKVAAPMLGGADDTQIEYILVPVIALIVIIYGVLGGVTAAYWTDVVQGICIILLSILLIPFGLWAVVKRFGDPEADGLMDGFRLLHEQLPEHFFTVVGSSAASDFPLHAIVIITVLNMVGIVVTPHFIVTGGGSAKSEQAARIGLVAGNFIKRFCTIGWVVTGLIVLALYADNAALQDDPDKAWGIATLELLGPLGVGFVGLMLACLLAALMSSVDCYMLVCSALVVRNIYVPYVNPEATEAQCLRLGRITGGIVVAGAVVLAWTYMDVFKQLQLTWIVPLTFAAPFWIGLYWRRATTRAAWVTLGFCLFVFFALPRLVPAVAPGLRTDPNLTLTTPLTETTTRRAATPSDVAQRRAAIARWAEAQEAGQPAAGPRPEPLAPGEMISESKTSGGLALFWDGGVEPVGEKALRETGRTVEGETTTVTRVYDVPLKAVGNFRTDLLLYHWAGADLTNISKATHSTLDLPFKVIAPFLVMVVVSCFTRRNGKEALDRLYVRMKTPVDPDPDGDRREVEESYSDPRRFDGRKLFKHPDLEVQRPTRTDFWGTLICFAICFLVIGLVVVIAGIGA